MYVEPDGDRVAALCPSANHPVSKGKLCIKGWNAAPAILGSQRLRTPLVRRGESLEPASWEEAISVTAEALRRVTSESGPAGVGVIGSAKTTNEECYSLARFARGVLGTPNFDGACRFYDASLIHGLLHTTGVPASTADLSSVEKAGSMLVVGANVMEQLAHIGSRIQDAADNGCRVVAADPRATRIAPQAAMYLHPKPGTDLIWLRALCKTILDRGLYVDTAPEALGFEELRGSLVEVKPDSAASECWIEGGAILDAAEMLAANPPTVVMFGLGVMQQPSAAKTIEALANVAMLLGGTVMPLRGQNNAQGSCDMGVARELLPGYGRVTDPEARKRWEQAWDCVIQPEPGMSAAEMVRACGSGDLKALLVFGENVALSAPGAVSALDSLAKAGFLAVADLYLTETAAAADVVFPACSFLEKDGTFTNIERRVQRVRKVFEPVGESRPDLAIIAALASALGRDISDDPAETMVEIADRVPQYAGVSYDSLDRGWGLPWPADGVRARFAALEETRQTEDPEYPFRLIASRIHYHQQTGTMACRSGVLAREYPETFAELCEADAERLKVRPGSTVRISSRSGSLRRRVALNESIPRGCVHVPHFWAGDSANALADGRCDPLSGVPAYKAQSVRIEAAE